MQVGEGVDGLIQTSRQASQEYHIGLLSIKAHERGDQ